jgi:hypothetical protein
MYYYQLHIFVLQTAGIGVSIGKVFCIHILSKHDITELLHVDFKKITDEILQKLKEQREFENAQKVDIQDCKTVHQPMFERAKIKITVTI